MSVFELELVLSAGASTLVVLVPEITALLDKTVLDGARQVQYSTQKFLYIITSSPKCSFLLTIGRFDGTKSIVSVLSSSLVGEMIIKRNDFHGPTSRNRHL